MLENDLLAELEKQKLEGWWRSGLIGFTQEDATRAWLKIKTSAGREEMLKRSEAWNL